MPDFYQGKGDAIYLLSNKILHYIFRFSIFVGQSLKQKQLIGHSFVEMGQFLIKLIQFVIFLKHLFHAVRQNPFMARSSLALQTTKIIIKSDFIIFIEEGTFSKTPYKTCHTCLQLSYYSFWIIQQLGTQVSFIKSCSSIFTFKITNSSLSLYITHTYAYQLLFLNCYYIYKYILFHSLFFRLFTKILSCTNWICMQRRIICQLISSKLISQI